jgi:hypothetical protein
LVSHQLIEPRVLLIESIQLCHLTLLEATVLQFPLVEGLLADGVPAAWRGRQDGGAMPP